MYSLLCIIICSISDCTLLSDEFADICNQLVYRQHWCGVANQVPTLHENWHVFCVLGRCCEPRWGQFFYPFALTCICRRVSCSVRAAIVWRINYASYRPPINCQWITNRFRKVLSVQLSICGRQWKQECHGRCKRCRSNERTWEDARSWHIKSIKQITESSTRWRHGMGTLVRGIHRYFADSPHKGP